MKTTNIIIRVSEREKKDLQFKAKSLGLSLSQFILLKCKDLLK